MNHPYSYARGVLNVRVKVEQDATLADLRERFAEPVELQMASVQYHNASKTVRAELKKSLPYFVGGAIRGKRADGNVEARTLLTLDVEAKEGQGPPDPPQNVLDKLEALGGEGWVYTSISHTPTAPRYRVVLPLGEPLVGADLSEAVLRESTLAAARKLGIEAWTTPESWVLSQPMFLPAKLKGGTFWEAYCPGKAWRTVRGKTQDRQKGQPADLLALDKEDPVVTALKRAGHYKEADARHPGRHFILCPWHDAHDTENDSKTAYYEPHYDGNPHAAVKCQSTSHEELTYAALVRWLRDEGHLRREEETADTSEVLEDYDRFFDKASIARYLETEPEEREWAWEQFAPVGKVTVLAGPGGVSKSMLMLTLMVYGALGLPFAGFKVSRPLRSLYVSYEDDTQELHKRVRRMADALKEEDDGVLDLMMDVNGALQQNLMLYAADEEATSWLLMVKKDQRSAAQRTARVDWLVGALKAAKVRALVIDPVVYTHQLEESSPGEMALYMQTLTYIAKSAGVAVVVLHHMHKTAQWATLEDINQGSLRGASSFADNSRSVAVLVSMPPKDAPRYALNPEEAGQYAVWKHVKHNYSAPLASVVFKRNGPLLVPTEVKPLAPAEAKERANDAKAAEEEKGLQRRAETILGWMLGQDDSVTKTMVKTQTGIRHSAFVPAWDYCVGMGWVEVVGGLGKMDLWACTTDGKQWRKGRK